MNVDRLVGQTAGHIHLLEARQHGVIERTIGLEVAGQGVVFDRFARDFQQAFVRGFPLFSQGLQLLRRQDATGFELADDISHEPGKITLEHLESGLGRGVGRVPLTIAAAHLVKFPFQRFYLDVHRGHAGIAPHAGEKQEGGRIATVACNGGKVGIKLPEEGFHLLNLQRGLIHRHLPLFEHGLQRGGPLAFAKTLHRLLGQSHLGTKARGLLDEKL